MFEKLAEDIYNATLYKIAALDNLTKKLVSDAHKIQRSIGGMGTDYVKNYGPLSRLGQKTRMEQYIVANNKKPGWQKVINQIKKGWPVNEGGFNPYEGSKPGSYSLRSGYETMFTGGKPITQDMVDTYLKGRMAAHNYLNKSNQLAYEPSLLERVKGWFA